MSGISSFITAFCVCLVLLGFLYILCPSGTMSKPVKYVFCLCFICCMLSCTVGLGSIDFSSVSFESDERQIITEEMSANTARMVFASALENSGIEFEKITVHTNKLADGSICISKVTVFTYASPEAVKAVFDTVDFEVEVINE